MIASSHIYWAHKHRQLVNESIIKIQAEIKHSLPASWITQIISLRQWRQPFFKINKSEFFLLCQYYSIYSFLLWSKTLKLRCHILGRGKLYHVGVFPPWDSSSEEEWFDRYVRATRTCWKASKRLPDRLDWAELIWVRLEVDWIQTATQIILPSARAVMAAPSGTVFWTTRMTLLESVLSWYHPLWGCCWCIPAASVNASWSLCCVCLHRFIQDLLNLSHLPWPHPAEWQLAREPRAVAAPHHWWHMQKPWDIISEKLWLQFCRPFPSPAYRLEKINIVPPLE